MFCSEIIQGGRGHCWVDRVLHGMRSVRSQREKLEFKGEKEPGDFMVCERR